MSVPPTVDGGRRVAVVGAGIVGVSCAWQLQRRGYQVTLIDRLPPGEACSFGNAGVIATSSFLPLVMPGAWRQVPKWLLSAEGPLALSWRDLPRTLGWFRQANRAATREGVASASRALHALHAGAVEDHLAQAQEAGCASLLQRSGYLFVYPSEEAYAREQGGWTLRRSLGMELRELDAETLKEVEPALTDSFACGVLLDGHATVLDPGGLAKALAADFERRQGRRLKAELHAVVPRPGGGLHLMTEEGEREADTLVLAAGVWSAQLARQLGHDFPLTAERGYHVMYEKPGVRLRQPVMFAEQKFVATSMEQGLRLAGTAEFAAVERPANTRRWAMMERLARRFLKGLDSSRPSRWVGARPSLPDSLPVIGRSQLHRDVVFAFGHGHTGLTASATTACIVAALIAGEAPPIDIAPFSPGRFPVLRAASA